MVGAFPATEGFRGGCLEIAWILVHSVGTIHFVFVFNGSPSATKLVYRLAVQYSDMMLFLMSQSVEFGFSIFHLQNIRLPYLIQDTL